MRLAESIELNRSAILKDAVAFGRSLTVLEHASEQELEGHLSVFLTDVSEDMRSLQSDVQSPLQLSESGPAGPRRTAAAEH